MIPGAALGLRAAVSLFRSGLFGFAVCGLGTVITMAGVGLLLRRHWGRQLWLALAVPYVILAGILGAAVLADMVSGGRLVDGTEIGLALATTAAFSGVPPLCGIWLLGRPSVKALFRQLAVQRPGTRMTSAGVWYGNGRSSK